MKMKGGPLIFYKSGFPSHVNGGSDPTTREQSTAELLKWISDVTIKRRSIRRSTHCSNLFAEAILSSALRKAKRDLASKQEEKRKKLKLFCLERVNDVEFERMEEEDSNSNDSQTDDSENDDQIRVTVNSYVYSDKSKSSESSNSNDSDRTRDEEVSACLSSLESFFNELKSVKVTSSSS